VRGLRLLPTLTGDVGGDSDGDSSGEVDTNRVDGPLPVITWDAVPRRPHSLGLPDPKDWRRPRSIHARSETVDIKEPFRTPFHAGQRGIVVFETFNEGEEIFKPSGRPETKQWTINPGDGQPRGFAFVWRRYQIEGQPAPLLFCAMVTVPANELIRRSIKSLEDEPRMPAILETFEVWPTWLGEDGASPDAAKALLKTMEGVKWTAAPEPKKPRPRKP
jgi:putative SOS response-associated peptidase YedK